MLRWLTAALLLIVAVVVIAWVFFRDGLLFALLVLRLAPGHDFSVERIPPPPNYHDEASWAALPWRQDAADIAVAPYVDRQSDAGVDVFFVHPTTFYSADGWNQPVPHPRTDALTDLNVMRGQAAVFNGCCRIFAPRYRQATLYAFMDRGENGAHALQLALRDVRTALEHYLTQWNDGRPFVLAGHSQGSRHLDVLLREWLASRPEAARMVVAYPIGFGLRADDHGSAGFPICDGPDHTGCIVSWNSVGPEVSRFAPTTGQVCVNPLSWRVDDAHVPAEQNPGSLQWPFIRRPQDGGATPEPPPLERQVADARCDDGVLWVSRIDSRRFSARPLGRDNYHVYDYGLFWHSLRENVQTRIDAWQESWQAAR